MTSPGARGSSPTAVVLVDLQNDFCHPDGVFARAGLAVDDLDTLVTNVNRLTRAARARSIPVVWVTTQWDGIDDLGLLAARSPFLAGEGLRRGTWGAQVLDALERDREDYDIEKQRFSGFYRTGLEALLRDLDAARLVVGGVRTDFCVESTVRDAFFRDFDVLVVRDAVAGYFDELHEHSLRLMGTVFARIVHLDDAITALSRAPDPVTAGHPGGSGHG